jgi:hypothetical protein
MRYTVSGIVQVKVDAGSPEEAWRVAQNKCKMLEGRHTYLILSPEQDTVEVDDVEKNVENP